MPQPLKQEHNFEIYHSCTYNGKTKNNHMAQMAANQNHYEIGFVVTGDRLTVTPFDSYELHSGMVGTMPLHMMHQTFSLSDFPYERILIKYSFPVADKIKSEIGEHKFLSVYNHRTHTFSPKNQKVVHHIFKKMSEEYAHPSDFTDYKLTCLLGLLFSFIIEHRRSDEPVTSFAHREISGGITNAMRYMEAHFSEKITLHMTACHCGFSDNYFSALFKKETGDTFSQYLQNIRMGNAIMLLNTTSMSINDISYHSGFSSVNYFCDAFKKKYQRSPLQYRKSLLT